VTKIDHVPKDNPLIKRLDRTKETVDRPDLQGMREERDRAERERGRAAAAALAAEKAAEEEQRARDKEERSYDRMFEDKPKASNKLGKNINVDDFEEDFM
jgi:hypothetical protein